LSEYTIKETLRYLGIKMSAASQRDTDLAREAVSLCRDAAVPRSCYACGKLEKTSEGILLTAHNIVLTGNDIAVNMKHASHYAIIALTLGSGVDTLIRGTSAVDMALAAAIDAAATAIAEEEADSVQDEISRKFAIENLYCGVRFSPGYGDLPISLQSEFVKALDTSRKIGLTCTDTFTLVPLKSITAVVGLSSKDCKHGNKCDDCTEKDTCEYKNI
jgi:hypothetical protein